MAKIKQYWKDLGEKQGSTEVNNKEFGADLPALNSIAETISTKESGRRDFLKMLGFSVTAAAVAASCEMPVRKSIPYTIKPEEITPGMPNYYATAFIQGGSYNSVLVKTREGRPIMVEGNRESVVSKGGVNSKTLGSLLGLYDNARIKQPLKAGAASDWKTVDTEIAAKLASASKIAILSNTNISPSSKRAIDEFIAKYPSASLTQFDAISYDGILNANEESFGKRAIPGYNFDKAKLIVSIGADFLGTWISPEEYSADYAKGRKLDPNNPQMNRHVQIESLPSLAGCNADLRIPVKASEEDMAVLSLYNSLASSTLSANSSFKNAKIDAVAAELKAAKGKSLVISGSNNKGTQLLVNAINQALGNYGSTISWSRANYTKQGSAKDVAATLNAMNSGGVDVAIIMSGNPAYSLGKTFTDGLAKVETSIDFSERQTETTALAGYVLPSNHYLESWGDANPVEGVFATIQPTIAPLFKTRQAEETLLKWAGNDSDYYSYVQETWSSLDSPFGAFNTLWTNAVHDGEVVLAEGAELPYSSGDLSAAAASIVKIKGSDLELKIYEKAAIGDSFGDNPWMLELADPISRITWDNYLIANPTWVESNGLAPNTKNKWYKTVDVTVNGITMNLAVVPVPGVPMGVAGVACGFGRTNTIHEQLERGVNVNPLIDRIDATGGVNLYAASWTAGAEDHKIAVIQQEHGLTHTMLGSDEENTFTVEKTRLIVKETTLDDYKVDHASGNYINDGSDFTDRKHWVDKHITSLYGDESADNPRTQQYGGAHAGALANGHHWGMGVDLNSCTGCGACVVACNAENNVPIVGHSEVHRAHEMNWLRIDKYHTGSEDNPQVIFQPLMCQHCDNAPCENVCPVAATNHSSEGLNQMTYNRCIGTRYCANNCPYKVRRFNWYDYQGADSFSNNKGFALNNDFDAQQKRASFGDEMFDGEDNGLGLHSPLSRMVLNPDVTVRSRGVIEKCSFCVQRIQYGKLEAKKGKRALKDSDVVTACQSVCPTNAITFGDTNNSNSAVSKVWDNERAFGVIEEIHTLPSVRYLVKVRNQKETDLEA